MFVTTEGIDGGGKTYAVSVIADWLREAGFDYVKTSEPGGTTLSKKIRQLLLDPENGWTPMAELMLFMADRAQHVTDMVRPALKEGKVVVCDRYVDSTMAYQGYGRKLDKKTIGQLNTFVTRSTMPDLTILLDLEPALAKARLAKAGKNDRMDSQAPEFYEDCRKGFLEIMAADPERFMLIDASMAQLDVAKAIKAGLKERFTLKGMLDDSGRPPKAGT